MRSHILHVGASKAQKVRRTIRYAAGCLAAVVGIANMLSSFVPRVNWDMFFGAWSIGSYHGMHHLLVVTGFFLLMLSYGLMRGKRQAWFAVLLLLILSLFLYIVSHGAVIITLLTSLLITLLMALEDNFRAKSDPPSVRRGNIALLVGLSIVTVYTIGGFVILYQDFEPLVDRVGIEEVSILLLSHTQLTFVYGSRAFFFERALPTLCECAVIYGIVSILRPVTATFLPDEQEQRAAADLTHLYGSNSISYFALETGKSYFFSASRKCVISYVLEGNVAVVAGDPIGPAEEILITIQQFVAFCQEQDWTMVFWQVREVFTDLYRSAGLHMLKIGEDAVIATSTFTLAGKAMANVRSSAKRAEKEGLQVVFYRGQVQNNEQLAQLEQISQAWLASKGGVEKGFSMGRFNLHGDPEQITALVVSNANQVHAFVTFVPIYARSGWGLDLMRRAECAAPGAMELLLARSIEYLKSHGANTVSLGLAPMNSMSQRDTDFLNASIDFLGRLFGNPEKSQSLFNFKKKFHPEWEGRYLVFSSTLTLPKVGWALYHAHQRNTSKLQLIYQSVREWQRQRRALQQDIVHAVG